MTRFFLLADAQVVDHIPSITGLNPQSNTHPDGIPMFVMDAREENKNLSTVQQIWDFLLAHHATRQDTLINIGGGIVSDTGGFAASTYKRGMAYINIPTTLLAMADAAHGGKTGINYGGIKNTIGLIAQPKEVLIYRQWLSTLSHEALLSGYGEIIKCALLQDEATLYGVLSALEDGDYGKYIDMAIAVKQRIVAADPTEQGLRKALNLGHTIGHAIEELSIAQTNQKSPTSQTSPTAPTSLTSQTSPNSQTPTPHGYCVVWGLVAALYLSVIKLGFDKACLTLLTHIMVEYYGRPTCKCSDYDRLIALMRQDKKNTQQDCICFTLLHKIGDPAINEVATDSEIKESLEYLFSV